MFGAKGMDFVAVAGAFGLGARTLLRRLGEQWFNNELKSNNNNNEVTEMKIQNEIMNLKH